MYSCAHDTTCRVCPRAMGSRQYTLVAAPVSHGLALDLDAMGDDITAAQDILHSISYDWCAWRIVFGLVDTIMGAAS